MSRKILVVADERFIGRLIEVVLTRAGYQVVTAFDCPYDRHEPLKRAEAAKPGLMILDVNVPFTNDFELLRNLKANPVTAGIPVIVVTAAAQSRHVLRGLQLGADFYVTLPFNPAQILACVKHILDSQPGVEETALEIESEEWWSPFIQLAHVVIRQAILRGASEIHLEPQADHIEISFRIDGDLRNMLTLPGHLQRKLVDRYRFMAGMSVEERGASMEGRIVISEADQEFDCRVHCQPVPKGERVVLAISAR